MAKTTEFVKFSLIQMPCCGQLLCWVNPRLPNYCPECGVRVNIFAHREHVIAHDDNAKLTMEEVKF